MGKRSFRRKVRDAALVIVVLYFLYVLVASGMLSQIISWLGATIRGLL